MALTYMKAISQIGMNATPTLQLPEGATLTFKKGAVIILTSGLTAEGGVNPTAIMGVAITPGQNLAAAGTITAGPYTGVCPAMPGQIFEATLDDSTASPYTSLTADLGAAYGITRDATTGFWFVDHSKTAANARVVIVGFKDAIGTSQARCAFVFKETQTAYT